MLDLLEILVLCGIVCPVVWECRLRFLDVDSIATPQNIQI